MPYAPHKINALIDLEPEKAKAEVLQALRKAKMHRLDAAKSLGCDNATLFRWIARLSLAKEIDKLDRLAKKEGWYHDKKGGRPRGSTRVAPE